MKKTTPLVIIGAGAMVYLTFAFIMNNINASQWSEPSRVVAATVFWFAAFISAGINEGSKK